MSQYLPRHDRLNPDISPSFSGRRVGVMGVDYRLMAMLI